MMMMNNRNLHDKGIVRALWEKETISPIMIYTGHTKQHIYDEICIKMDDKIWDHAEAIEDTYWHEQSRT